MAPPDTNLEKQERRHKGPLIGISVVILFAIIMMLVWGGGDEITEEDAQDGEAQIESTIDGDQDGTVENMAEEEGEDTPITDEEVEDVNENAADN